MSRASAGKTPTHPVVKRLRIRRFRGLEDFTWYPNPRMNVLLGGGDVGKTTVLDAIALLLKPSNSHQVSESDFWNCDTSSDFSVEGVFWFPDESPALDGTKDVVWPWNWNGSELTAPDLDGDPASGEEIESVLLFRVRANEDFEIFWEIVDPSENVEHLPVALRRQIGLVWLEGDDRNDKDLRLVYGSALDRLLGDRALKSRLAQEISDTNVRGALSEEAGDNLSRLNSLFVARALPNDLDVGLATIRGLSLNALIGLTALEGETRLAFTKWGAGTRRLAALEIAAANQTGAPLTVVDEIERGLEPHRQRLLMRSLTESDQQVFLTTHSPTALGCAPEGALWYVDSATKIGCLGGPAAKQAGIDPEAFLARLLIVAEGKTEVEFLQYFLDRAFDGRTLELGIWITDGAGNDNSLALLEDLSRAGIRAGAFVDHEGRNVGRWSRMSDSMGPLLFQWDKGCLEENVIRFLSPLQLRDFVQDPLDELTGERQRSLQERLRTPDKNWETLTDAGENLGTIIAEAASGRVPEWVEDRGMKNAFKSHARVWFKRSEGGRELAEKCVVLDLLDDLQPDLLPFLNGVRAAVGSEPVKAL